MNQLYLLLQWHTRHNIDIKESMKTDWPVYFGHHAPWKNCNVRGQKGKNARKRIWMRIKRLQEEGFNDQGKRKRKSTGSSPKITKRRRSDAARAKRSYWKKKVEEVVPEEERVELALSILEDYCPGSRLWFTKAIPNMKEVIIFFPYKTKFI